MDKKVLSVGFASGRNEMLYTVVEYSLLQQESNVGKNGSCWGCYANTALITLAQFSLITRLTSQAYSFEEDRELVHKFVSTNFCIFTAEDICDSERSISSIRKEMKINAEKLAIPVLEDLKGTALENGALYNRLKSAVDRITRLTG